MRWSKGIQHNLCKNAVPDIVGMAPINDPIARNIGANDRAMSLEGVEDRYHPRTIEPILESNLGYQMRVKVVDDAQYDAAVKGITIEWWWLHNVDLSPCGLIDSNQLSVRCFKALMASGPGLVSGVVGAEHDDDNVRVISERLVELVRVPVRVVIIVVPRHSRTTAPKVHNLVASAEHPLQLSWVGHVQGAGEEAIGYTVTDTRDADDRPPELLRHITSMPPPWDESRLIYRHRCASHGRTRCARGRCRRGAGAGRQRCGQGRPRLEGRKVHEARRLCLFPGG
mmetsp:Transcript_42670/g.96241  ORF Transcript_42670/g.96241 Transcript_42670/m.96241 type:complete len:283 (+) Transcript_42670:3-851(+)